MPRLRPLLVAGLALLGALAFAAWLFLGPWSRGALSDGLRSVEEGAEVRYATWGDARPSPFGVADRASRASLSADGRWLAFAAVPEDADGEGAQELYLARVRDGFAEEPARIDTLASPADESAPAFGGEFLYFASDRAGGAGGVDLWRARFADGAVGAPEPVPGPANTAGDELDPAPLGSDDQLVFAADRDGQGLDLYLSPLGAGEVVRLAALCSARDEREAVCTSSGRALAFASDRAGGAGGFDLYRAARCESDFAAPVSLAPLNTAADERAPLADPDELALGFVRRRPGDARGGDPGSDPVEDEGGALLRSTAVELFRAPGRPIGWLEWLALAGLLALALFAWLARRFPALENFTKCLLVSVVAHLLIVWWFHAVALELGEHARERRREPMHVRLEPRTPLPVSDAPTSPELALPEPAELPESDARGPERADAVAAFPRADRTRVAPRLARLEDLPVEPARPAEETRPAPTEVRPVTEADPAPDLAAAADVRLPEVAQADESLAAGPDRFAASATRSATVPERGSVATRAEERLEPRPSDGSAEPSPARAALLALRESAPESAVAGQAAELDLGALEEPEPDVAGAPSPTSRSLGAPSRPAAGRSLGSPAATSRSGSLARAAPLAEASEPRVSGVAPDAGRAQARNVLPAGPGSLSGGRPAALAAELSLGELGTSAAERAANNLAAPERAKLARGAAHAGAPAGSQLSGLARSASELPEEAGAAPGLRTALEATPGASVAARSARELAGLAAAGVAQPASEARELALGELDAEADDAGAPARTLAAPERAARPPEAQSGAEPTASTRASLAQRGAAPAEEQARGESSVTFARPGAPGATGAGARLALADAPRSVGRPAAEPAPDSGSDWLGGLPDARADGGGALEEAAGPRRAPSATPAPGRAAPRPGGLALARPAASESAPESAPAKSDWDATPYRNRGGAEKARALELYGGSERTEAAVAQGLAYLAGIQRRDGSWGDPRAVDPKYGRIAVGKTALCTLAFLGAGHTQRSGTEHSAVVAQALEYLLAVQDEASGHFGESSAYDHGIATYAVAECFALTRDDALRPALERALAHVLAMQSHQDDERFRGGWGYYFADGSHYDPWPRTSITAWQVMALESARLSGLRVPDAAFDEARAFLANAHDPHLRAYRYNHEPERLASAYPTLPASTPAALFALALLGEDITAAQHAEARAYVLDRAPDGYRYSGELEFVRQARGNPYFWYYGTLAMFRAGGAEWQRWNVALQESLLPAQARDGSWQPIDPYARYARDAAGDKSYTTALCVLSLEVYYRYYLPLLKVR